ncbi:extracellular solute-binding protein [Paenibacillus mendelii]|uniref:Extracellular solute-binding protein n=1 Tax=Paenibacillus mendelii TaxID=206163 RepID=A0ABV6J989_9BACL|nr:extracellular solute-binding protein [Paenibacillus mendelii]MCQ6561190.1 extracellular solute-binding protein [Paenibacillus mendelii]
MELKKKLSGIISIALAVSLMAGCATKNDPGNAGADTAGNGSKSTEPIEYTMSITDSKLKWETPVDKLITEKTGVSIKYLPIVGDEAQKMDLWLASGDYPDLLFMSPNMTGKYRDGDAIIPLEDLIDQYGPNIKKRFGKNYELLRDTDGHIYSLYGVNLTQEAPANAAASFLIQYDVLKEAGYPELKTLDQLVGILKDYYAKHPTIDGKETIPFSAYWGGLTFANPAIAAAGLPDQGFNMIDKDNNVKFALTEPFAKRYYQFLNTLQTEGLLDKNIFGKGEENLAKIAQGRVLAEFMPGWLLNGAEKSIVASGKLERQYAKIPLYFDENTEDHSFVVTPSGSSSNWAISNKAEHPERIIQMIDFLFSDEGQLALNWGVEGLHYEVKDGKRVQKQEYLDKAKMSPDLKYEDGPAGPITSFSIGDGAKLEDGDYATPNTKEAVIASYDDMTKEVLSKYGKTTWSDFLPKPEPVPALLWQLNEPEETKAIFKKFEDTLNKEIPKLILAKSADEFEGAWNRFVEQIDKAGKVKYEETWTKTWQEYVKRYNDAMK